MQEVLETLPVNASPISLHTSQEFLK